MNLLFGSMGNDDWYVSTFFFYLFIIIFCFAIAKIFQERRLLTSNGQVVHINIIMPMVILLLVKGFSVIGTDTVAGYFRNFRTALSLEELYDYTLETGYRWLNVIVRNITSNYQVLLFVIAICTLLPVAYILIRYEKKLDIAFTIMAFVAVFFFQGFSLLRIYIAASISLLVAMMLYEKKYGWALLYIFLAMLFHQTSIIMIIPYACFVFRVDKRIMACLLTAILGVIVLFRDSLSTLLTGRYSVYAIAEDISFGVEAFAYYVPLIVLFIYVKHKLKGLEKNETEKFLEDTFIWVILGMFVGLLSYIVPIFGRMFVFSMPIILFIGSALRILKTIGDKKGYAVVSIFTFLYLILRFVIYINGYYALDGIMPYINCFDMKF